MISHAVQAVMSPVKCTYKQHSNFPVGLNRLLQRGML